MTRVAVTAVFALVLAGCSGSASDSARYQLGEFFISGPEALVDGSDGVTAHNTGEFPHTLVVTRPDGHVIAASGLINPDETVHLDFALPPGTYQFTCRIVGQDAEGRLVDHYERGMNTTVSIGG